MLDLILPGTIEPRQCLAATTADRHLILLDPYRPDVPLIKTISHFQDSPLLDMVILHGKYLLVGAMSGRLVVYNTTTDRIVNERKDHSKYIVKIATWSSSRSTLVATAAWDAKVHIYKFEAVSDEEIELGSPLATLSMESIPETILFLETADRDLPVLLLTRRDSTLIHYFELSFSAEGLQTSLVGKQNLAPHSNAWVVFSPSDIQLCPSDPSIAAVATSSVPHMKLLVVRLLVPPKQHARQNTRHLVEQGSSVGSASDGDTAAQLTQVAQARAQSLLQDREEAAILVNTNTMAPQTVYSTPKLAWRPDGSGVYVTSDDGRVRGFEASTGKLTVALDAHDGNSKIRCLWAGYIKDGTTDDWTEKQFQECLISGGFDQKLILWRTVTEESIG